MTGFICCWKKYAPLLRKCYKLIKVSKNHRKKFVYCRNNHKKDIPKKKIQWGVGMKRTIAAALVLALLAATCGGSFVEAAYSIKTAGQLKAVKYTNSGGETVDISVTGYTDYSIMKLSNPGRIVIDIFNAFAPGKQQYVQAGGNIVKSIRYAQFEPYTARVVLEVEGEPEYGVDKTDSGLLIYFGDMPESAPAQEPAPPSPAGGSAVKKTLSVHKYFNVEYTPGDGTDNVGILIDSYSKYKVMRLTGPDRLVIDIPNAKYSSADKKIETNGSQVSSIRYARYNKTTARIVFDLTGQAQYTVNESKGKLLFTLQAPEYRNITYHSNGDRVYFILKGAKLTEGEEFMKKLYSEAYDKTGFKYTISFPSKQADMGSGVFKINDEYIKTLEVTSKPEAGTTTLTFTAPVKLTYLIFTRGSLFTRDNLQETSVTLLKPAAAKDKLVVIDAGHGGSAPGAIYKDVVEKELNLDVAQRLNGLLEKKGVKTYMIRDDDSYVANYERAYIANKLGASLYISVHHNAMDDPNFGGTMTLFCPSAGSSAFNGKSFAAIIQQKLLSALKTVDRKTIERPNLVVLRATAMPSALAEIAFITNAGDRANLQKAAFRQKAAQALCDAVVKALPQVK
jgi:N-acetylmuramoyl-L-alanine amidase